MPKFTKADIDGLVEGMPSVHADSRRTGWVKDTEVPLHALRVALYLAAGLTAEGEPKPERVRCWMVPDYYPDGRSLITESQIIPIELPGAFTRAIPGTFVPDGTP